MDGNKVSDYNKTNLESDNTIASYVAGDYHALGNIAHACVRLLQVTENDESVRVKNHFILQDYYNNVYKKHSCLVLKANKKCGYTRNNICKAIRNRYTHTHKPPHASNKNQQEKLNMLHNFIDDVPMEVLFCITSSWIATPFIASSKPPRDSKFYMKEPYTNASGKKSELGVIESIIFNTYDEIAHIIKNGKMGWSRDKVIWPLVDSHKNYLGDRLFNEIKATMPFLQNLNVNVQSG